MDENINDFVLCDDNWDQIKQVTELQTHLERMRLWFQADSVPQQNITSAIRTCERGLKGLLLELTALQLKLISNLK